jgi:hypothetical protein
MSNAGTNMNCEFFIMVRLHRTYAGCQPAFEACR